jgi:glycosyltransferase involved in cell wall biosynthesis
MNDKTPELELLSVVMPAFNEEASIERVILDHVRVLNMLAAWAPRWEIVCVDDGSQDRTPELLRSLQLQVPQLRVIRQHNQGIFAAVTRAYREAQGSHIFSTGSDGQWPPENLEPMLARVREGADLVIGVRTNRREVYSFARRIVSLGFSLFPRLLFGVSVQDAGSIKMGRREVFQFDLISSSPFFEAERIVKASRAGLRVEFVPIRFLTRTGGRERGASAKNVFTSLCDLARCVRTYGLRRK